MRQLVLLAIRFSAGKPAQDLVGQAAAWLGRLPSPGDVRFENSGALSETTGVQSPPEVFVAEGPGTRYRD